MNTAKPLSARRALLVFLLAMAGSVTGTLAGPRIVGLFAGAPDWILPTVFAASIVLALIAVYVAFHLATGRKRHYGNRSGGEA